MSPIHDGRDPLRSWAVTLPRIGTVRTLAERTFTCRSRGMVLDRDVNASRNLLKLAASGAERV
jgi:transposase